MKNKLFVPDANVLVSAALSPLSTNAQALKRALMTGKVIYSNDTWTEFMEVLFRQKFDKYFTIDIRKEIAGRFLTDFEEYSFADVFITACRDPKDDKYLELAVAASASCIITGDEDLLTLHPFRAIPILNASDFLSQ